MNGQVHLRFCDELPFGFGWIVDESATRTSHALADGGRVWLIDPVDWPPALERMRELGSPVAVVQLLDRHRRDCAALAIRLGVPHFVVPDELPGSPFTTVSIRRRSRWHENALWCPATRTLVVAEAIGTNRFFRPPGEAAGVHLLLRPAPPRRQLGAFEPEHLLVGHGEGVHGPAAAEALRSALARSRTDLARQLLTVPALALDAWRRRRVSL